MSKTLPLRFVMDRILDETGYFVSQIMTVPSNDSANIHLRNPDDNRLMWLAAVAISATGDQDVLMHDGFDSIDDGDEITIQNAHMDEGGGPPDSGPFEAYYNSDFEPGDDGTVPIEMIRGSGPNATRTVSIYPSVVGPGREVVIEFKEQSGNEEEVFVAVLLLTSY